MAIPTIHKINVLVIGGDGTKVCDRKFHTNKATIIKFNCENVNSDGSNAYGRDVQACIVRDETPGLTPESLIGLCDDLSGEYGDVPIVLCGSDENHLPHRQLGDNVVLPYFFTTNSHNLEPPIFLYLARKVIAGTDELRFVEPPQPIPEIQQMQYTLPVAVAPQHAPGSDTTNPAAGKGGDENCCWSACEAVGSKVWEGLKGCYYATSIVDFFMENL